MDGPGLAYGDFFLELRSKIWHPGGALETEALNIRTYFFNLYFVKQKDNKRKILRKPNFKHEKQININQ